MKSDERIRNVSDTALWVACYRAMESERPDAIFRDPFASRLAGERGRLLLAGIPKGKRFAWPMIVRTAVMDEILLHRIQQGVDTVVNLASGLDVRPFRMALPPSLRWIDVDFHDMQEYKAGLMKGEAPRCQLETVKLDLRERSARRELFNRIAADSRETLLIAEGLLVYLSSDEVEELSKDLHEPESFRWWLIDIASPRLLEWMKKTWARSIEDGGAEFRFAPGEGTDFFARQGWSESEFRGTFEESIRLRRAPAMAPIWRLLSLFLSKAKKEQMRRMAGIALLERKLAE